jgi:tetratricopeptide (TPR) repeat protein
MTKKARAFLLLLATPLWTAAAQGQGRPALKRGLPVVAQRPVCPSAAKTAAPTPTAVQRRQGRELAQRAQQSAILCDRTAARDQLRQATTLDPANPDLAYQLARAQEAIAANDDAVAAYCRFLALAPNAPEAAEARERLAGLAPSTQATVPDRVLAPFRTGVTAYEAGRYAEAEGAFSNAIAQQRDWADAYYNRALTNVVRGRREQAIVDLQQYLRLRPEAEDRQTVIARINGLRGGPLSPGAALGLGLVIPGAGQMYTGRRVFGVLTLAAAGGAVAYALKSGPVTKEFVVNPKDPFGNPLPPFVDKRTETGHPNLVPGLAVAGAIAGATAIEAYMHARSVNAREARFGAGLVPLADGLALRLTLR